MPEIVEAGEYLRIRAMVSDRSPAETFQCWIVPGILQRWWPPQAEMDVRAGGEYHLTWPSQGWHLRGRFIEVDSPRRLAFTWKWDHDPNDAETTVDVRFLPSGTGTELLLTHGAYPATDAGRERRQEHQDGWIYFLGRLESLAYEE